MADPFVISYDPLTGKEWWRFEGTTGDCGPSPVVHRDLVIAGGEYSYYMFAIRADGTGDVTETHKVWEGEEALPDACSPLAFDHYVLWMSSGAVLACYDIEKGEMLWEHEFPENTFYASPALADQKVYLFSKEGPCFVGVVTDEEFKIEHTNELGEKCVTSPAFQPGRIYVRGEEHLFCLGQ
ncbi:MAG TPA: PQQ-binding-like beta-propeller repeat protein [Thermogutta sp.]|nr:PQQ-binding-like beta-propeller repeat protein [Thermogutta sp.]